MSAINTLKDWIIDRFTVKIKLLQGAVLPKKAYPDDAGFDVYVPQKVIIKPGEIISIPLNFKIELPKNTWASLNSKSGLSMAGLLVIAGVIDCGYTGIVSVVVANINQDPKKIITINKKNKIAQMIIHPHSSKYEFRPVTNLSVTKRGDGGFNSTGSE